MKPFYTVISSDGRSWIRYVEPPDWTEQEYPGAICDPGEAVREFRACKPLRKDTFDRRILQHKQDVENLRSWIENAKKIS